EPEVAAGTGDHFARGVPGADGERERSDLAARGDPGDPRWLALARLHPEEGVHREPEIAVRGDPDRPRFGVLGELAGAEFGHRPRRGHPADPEPGAIAGVRFDRAGEPDVAFAAGGELFDSALGREG